MNKNSMFMKKYFFDRKRYKILTFYLLYFF